MRDRFRLHSGVDHDPFEIIDDLFQCTP